MRQGRGKARDKKIDAKYLSRKRAGYAGRNLVWQYSYLEKLAIDVRIN
jgi:hypothetical protein